MHSRPFRHTPTALHHRPPTAPSPSQFPLHRLLPALLPILPLLPLPALSAAAAEALPPTPAAGDTSFSERLLGTAVLALLIYATLGAIVITAHNVWVSRNAKREARLLKELVRRNPGRKTLSDGTLTLDEIRHIARGNLDSPKLFGTAAAASGNRESRRLGKKAKARDNAASKRRPDGDGDADGDPRK